MKRTDKTLFLDSQFDKAIVGHFGRCGQPTVVAYDVEKVVKVLIDKDGMSREEAEEFFSFNMEGAWMGTGTPAFVYRTKRKAIEAMINSP
jgi:hypothetical protein